MLYKACSVRKAKQLAINKHMDNRKKAMRAGKKICSDLATIKAINRNWNIFKDQYTRYKELHF